MVLGNDLHGIVVFHDADVAAPPAGFDEASLDFEAGIVGMVKDAELRVSTLAVEVVVAVIALVEVHAPFHQSAYAFGTSLYHLFYGCAVGDVVASDDGVFNMLFEAVDLEIRHTRHSALGLCRVRLVNGGFADECHLAFT